MSARLCPSVLRSFCNFQSRFQGTTQTQRQFCQLHQMQSLKLLQNRSWKSFHSAVRQYARDVGKKRSLTPVEEVETVVQGGFGLLARPFAWTVLVSGCSFGGAIVWQYESLRTYFQQNRDNTNQTVKEKFYSKAGGWRHHANVMWNQLTPGKKLVVGIIGINTSVFMLWKVKAIQTQMLKYFASSPFSGAPCASMVLSTFSHYSTIHIAANMFVLWSFSEPVTQLLGKEQFLAFFMTAGVMSGFVSYFFKVARASAIPSIGASGAIMGLIGLTCCQFPDARLSIAFVDMLVPHSFSASSAMKALLVFDAMGVILGWRLFDHAAHLGGMLFGIWYQKYGRELIWTKSREPLMKIWHDFRGKP